MAGEQELDPPIMLVVRSKAQQQRFEQIAALEKQMQLLRNAVDKLEEVYSGDLYVGRSFYSVIVKNTNPSSNDG